MTPWNWNTLDLFDSRDCSFDDVPEKAGIYIWRLKVAPQMNPSAAMPTFLKTLEQQLERPSAVLPRREFPTACFGETSVGGGRLTEEKRNFLLSHYGNSSARCKLTDFCHKLEPFSPVIYVGKAVNLRERLRSHHRGHTDLKEYIVNTLRREWREMSVSFMFLPPDHCEDPEKTNQLLAVLEMISQLALAPHGVRRMG
jgi:hypothetical protein